MSLCDIIKFLIDCVSQGGPTSFFPLAKNSFPVGLKRLETSLGTVFEN